ncbi:branched-chain amino acid transaminase [Roseivirga sp. UBA1976]|uniref:branched-chain amino acid transaminase n=1 Tax=Roseivirga sp. UBA1976 TaxID=1947386 RepID=UPI0025803305|nr:branched-chain amino acid transaminase [Roseivirga sp. UBA1976]MEC7755820.1 branched-chain amino acid transaminase [Bacteroidota bacterium]
MYYNDQTTIFLDGQWLKAGEARASLYSQSMHYGSGVFEGIRSYATAEGTSIFKAEAHYERLIDSAHKMHMPCDYTVSQLVDWTYELLERNGLKDAYIRPLLYLGENMSLQKVSTSHLFICAWEWGRYLGDNLLNVMVSSYERPNPRAVPVSAKVTGHYTNSILATTEAKGKGFDEALLLDENGSVAEGSGANFFFEKDGELFTPPLGNILPGITRATVFELAAQMGIKVNEAYFSPHMVKGADGAFFTGTAAEIAGIEFLDGSPFRLPWKKTIGYRIAQHYQQLVRKTLPKTLINA